MTDYGRSEATPYLSLEGSGAVWHGTWGKHYFTLRNLLLRAVAYWNQFSDEWASYDYMKFTGATIYIPQTVDATFLINFESYLQTKDLSIDKKSNEDKWVHPGILLHTPKTHIIFPTKYYRHKKMYKIKIYPPPGWAGFQRFPDAMGYIMFHWCWTWCDFKSAFFDTHTSTANTCEAAPWWATNGNFDKWIDRSKYECLTDTSGHNWGPFLQCKFDGLTDQSLYFLYRINLKFAGNCIWRPLPRNYANQGLIPDPPQNNAETRTNSKKRPHHEQDILPGDLDSDGIITDRAYSRITGDYSRPKRPKMEDTGRLEHLAHRVRGVLSKYNLLRK